MQNTSLAGAVGAWGKDIRLRLAALVLFSLVFRLALLPLIHNPGLHDPLHYYNLGRRLSQGQDFTIDYIWHYSHIPAEITHPIDHWLPLAGLAAAVGMRLGGVEAQASLALFIFAGAVIPLLVFWASKQLGQSDTCAFIAAAFSAVLPDLLWNSLRTDTTILNSVFVCAGILLVNSGLQAGRKVYFALSGAAFGLAYLTRNDALLFLPMLLALFVLYRLMGKERGRSFRLAWLAITIVVFAAVIAPWLLRNQLELGMLGSAETGRMFFMVGHADHYAYGQPITLQSMFERQTLVELTYKRLFEFAAAVKQMAVSLDLSLFALAAVGAGWLIWRRERERLLLLCPTLCWLLGILFVYPFLLPLKSQAGSFEKAFLAILPLLIPLSTLALNAFVRRDILKWTLAGLILFWLGFSSVRFVEQETAKADRYYGSIEILVEALQTLPDQNGDGEIRLMSQDPYVLSYYGYASVMTPLASREDTIALAESYAIDYLMLPAGRPPLDPLYLGAESDSRFQLVARLTEVGERPFELYRFADENTAAD